MCASGCCSLIVYVNYPSSVSMCWYFGLTHKGPPVPPSKAFGFSLLLIYTDGGLVCGSPIAVIPHLVMNPHVITHPTCAIPQSVCKCTSPSPQSTLPECIDRHRGLHPVSLISQVALASSRPWGVKVSPYLAWWSETTAAITWPRWGMYRHAVGDHWSGRLSFSDLNLEVYEHTN